MSDTFQTDDARLARKLSKQWRKLAGKRCRGEATPEDIELELVIDKQLQNIHVDGVRYGNHRKWKAKEKVDARRHARRLRNRETDVDI